MARERMITRTINSTEVTVLCMDIEKVEVIEKTVIITGYTPAGNNLLKIAQKKLDTDTIKATHIKNAIEQEILYGMSEAEFIKFAKVLSLRETPKTEAPQDVTTKLLEKTLKGSK